jgi:hypothetical protein
MTMAQSNADFIQPDSPTAHDELREWLPEYAMAIILRHDVRDAYSRVIEHLGHCASCRDEVADLVELGGALYRGELEPALDAPRFALDFLRPVALPTPAPKQSWWRDALGRLSVQLSVDLLSALQPRPQLLAARSGGAPLLSYQPQADPPGSFFLTIDILEQRESDSVTLQVQIDLAERDALDQDQIVVRAEGGGMAWSARTNESGMVVISDIPRGLLTDLLVTIDPSAPA